MNYEVIVIGGGPAGLSAALTLGRARRATLLLDDGSPRNAAASASHGFLTRDGLPPEELRSVGRQQLETYGVEHRAVRATGAQVSASGVEVRMAEGSTERARCLILATGVKDILPEVRGLAARWGQSVHHCPYCHGWEIRDGKVGILAGGPMSVHQARLLRQWSSDVMFFTNGSRDVPEADQAALRSEGIEIEDRIVDRLDGPEPLLERVVFVDGTSAIRDCLFVSPPQRQRSPLAAQLGCAMQENEIHVAVDARGRTSVSGVYAVGDMAEPWGQQIVLAAAGGVRAAADINASLIFGEDWMA